MGKPPMKISPMTIPPLGGCFRVLCLLFASASPQLLAQDPPADPALVEVGGRTLKVPAPEGYVRCDGVNMTWDQAMNSLMPASNRMLATFGTQQDQDLIRKGTPSDYPRNFNIQVVRSIESMEIGQRTFAEMRGEIQKEVQKAMASIEADLKKITDQSNKQFTDNFGVDVALSITDTAVLGFFEDTENSLGFTMAMKVGSKDNGETVSNRAVVACLMAPVNGRAVNLYSTAPYTGKADIAEVEKSVLAWRDAIQAVNPRLQGPAAGFDWQHLRLTTAIGAGIGLIVGLGFWILGKSKRSKSE